MKTAVFDIETTALEGIGAGMLLCACVRPLNTNRTRTYRLDAYLYKPSPDHGAFNRQERDLLIALVGELKTYDLLIGHNITNFDLGFLRTRAYRHNIPFPLRPFVYDTMQAFRRVKMRTIMNGFGKPSEIILEEVSFQYVPDQTVLKHISVRIGPGQKVAIVGPTGMGKSTLVSLLPRFYDAFEGRVLIDGVDVREYQLKSLRRQISMVCSNRPWFFP